MVRTVSIFQETRLKIERANHHIRDIDRRVSRLEESCTSATEANPKFGYEQINTISQTSHRLLAATKLQNQPRHCGSGSSRPGKARALSVKASNASGPA
jgi:hypothetical protein